MSTYNKNFLTKVGFRIDYNSIELGKLQEFAERIQPNFPIMEAEAGEEGMIDIDLVKKEVKQNITPILSWNFFNNERTKRIKIHPRYFVIEYNIYRNSEELMSDIKQVLIFIDDFDVKVVNRASLQYTNEIRLSGSDFLSWGNYINSDLLGQLKFITDSGQKIARSMGNVIIKEDFGDINLNYGLWNSNFPNEVNEKVFILDFNGYSRFPIDTEGENIEGFVKECNKKIESLFESIIEDGLRTELNS